MNKYSFFDYSSLAVIPSGNFLVSLEIANDKLNSFFEDKTRFQKIINQTFENVDDIVIDSLLGQISDSSIGIKIELLSNKILGGINGAYTNSGINGEETIYLNDDFIKSADSKKLVAVLLEEFGHSIDNKINGKYDSYGDEGAIFSSLISP